MKKRVLAMLLAVALVVSLFAACTGNNTSSTSTADTSSTSSTSSTTTDTSSATTDDGNDTPATTDGPDYSEHVDAVVYENYDWFTAKEWGADAASAYMKEKFNIDLTWSKPDADAAARLNIMLSGNDLPESIVLTAGTDTIKVWQTGKLRNLDDLQKNVQLDLSDATIDMMRMENGDFVGIPNWPHAKATGGNYYWMVNTRIYEAVGSPDIKTLDDLHAYATAVKEANLEAYSGTSIIPAILGQDTNGYYALMAMHRSLGGRNIANNYYTQENNTIEFGVDNDIYLAALREVNKWYREGLINADRFTDSSDQFLEKVTNGRVGLLFYDFSQDDTNNFRRILRESTNNEESYEVIGSEYFLPDTTLFPPAEGVTRVYGDECTTPGWQNFCITTSATEVEAQRLYDLFCWMLTKDGSINMMYGPDGGLWNGLNEDGLPQLIKSQDEFTSTELDAAGAWFWASPAHSDNVDGTKFAVNDLFPADKRNWVVAIQAHTTSYADPSYSDGVTRQGQKFVNDGLFNLVADIDPQSDDGVNQQLINDQCAAELPKIMMAADDATFDSLVKGLSDYAHANGVDKVMEYYQARLDKNYETMGYNPYEDPNLYSK